VAEAFPSPEPPRRRFHPLAFALGLVAWCVIAALVLIPVLVRSAAEGSPSEAAAKDSLNLLLMRAQARYLLGLRELAGAALGDDRQITAQAQALNTGPIDQRLRFVALAGELVGPDGALNALDQLEKLIADKNAPHTAEQDSQLVILRQLYSDYRRLRLDAPSVTQIQRRQLRKELGWFGDLALAPAGQPGMRGQVAAIAGGPAAAAINDDCPDPQERTAVLRPAQRVTVVGVSVFVAALGLLFLGSCGLLLLVVLLFLGMLRGGLKCGSAPAGVYAETFALWMTLYGGLGYGIGRLALDRHTALLATGLAMLSSLVVLLWPVLRGVPWQQVRENIGLTLGRRPAAEPTIGLGCYIMGYPLMFAGLVVMLILMGAQHLLNGGGASADDLVSPSTPSHPIVAPLARGDWEMRLLIFVLASIVAPIVEETIFRGVLYRHLRELTRGLGIIVSVALSGLISSFIFAVIHPQGLLAVPLLTALAWGFVLAREWRGTLVPSMVAHGLNNGLVLLVSIGMLGD